MGQNKDEAIAKLRRHAILDAAARVSAERGWEKTTAAAVIAVSGYSRRTVYAYFPSREAILYALTERDLRALSASFDAILAERADFRTRLAALCGEMLSFRERCPAAAACIDGADAAALPHDEAAAPILALGGEICAHLAGFVAGGIRTGDVSPDVVPLLAVQLLFAGSGALAALLRTKEAYLTAACGMEKDELRARGIAQLAASIPEARA